MARGQAATSSRCATRAAEYQQPGVRHSWLRGSDALIARSRFREPLPLWCRPSFEVLDDSDRFRFRPPCSSGRHHRAVACRLRAARPARGAARSGGGRGAEAARRGAAAAAGGGADREPDRRRDGRPDGSAGGCPGAPAGRHDAGAGRGRRARRAAVDIVPSPVPTPQSGGRKRGVTIPKEPFILDPLL